MSNFGWRTLCIESKEALAHGERNEARRLARQAAALAPDQEEPWLLLAAMASPAASRAYLKQALKINPRSQAAIKALRWAEERARVEKPKNIQAHGPVAALTLPRFSSPLLIALVVLTVGFALFAWLRPPGVDDGLRFVSGAAAHGIDEIFATSTYTPTATSTNTATPTSTSTPTSTPTFTPTFTPSPTATATTGANPEKIAKSDVEIPVGMGPNERWIDIDLTNQSLSAYEGADLVNYFIVSTGRGGSPTVTGTFHIWVKVRIQAMSGPGYYIKDVPWVMYFYQSYGIHGTWWHNNFGTPMSAGCVNMTIDDAKWMYDWASVGTTVKVHY